MPSLLLRDAENEVLFQTIGRLCVVSLDLVMELILILINCEKKFIFFQIYFVHSLVFQHFCFTLIVFIFHYLQTLATGVVQLYLADQADRNRWSKRCCGVACFVKDSSKRSFYIRVYDIKVNLYANFHRFFLPYLS